MKRLWTVVAAIASIVALVAIPAAYPAYTSAKFEVTQTGTTTTIKASVDPNDDPTAELQIILPSGMQVTTNQAPGTALGRVRAAVRALDLGGADLQLEGEVLVAAPGQVSAAVQEACVGGTPVTATWVLALSAPGRQLEVPAFFVRFPGPHLDIYVCFGPPDVPVGTPGRAPFGAKLSSLEATFTGVFSASACTWTCAFYPYTPLVGEVNWDGVVSSSFSAVAPVAVRLTARKAGAGATLVGRVTQGGVGQSAATVTMFGGSAPDKLRSLGRARVAFDGAFTFRARAGAFFRARAVAGCFMAHSKVVRKR
jgi:hypothetical protein